MRRYLENVVAADQGMIRRVFHVLNWTTIELEWTIERLLDDGTVRKVQIESTAQPLLLSASLL